MPDLPVAWLWSVAAGETGGLQVRRILPGVVTLIGVLFLLSGGLGTLFSIALILGDKSHHLGSHLVALLWSVSAFMLGWAVLSSRFLLYALGTLVILGEAIGAWVTGRLGTAIYGTALSTILLAYAWRWLGELADEAKPPVESVAGES